MQQTQKYKLNLIETSDTFSPAPLNENAEKLEAAIAAEATAVRAEAAAGDKALEQRIITLEGNHAVGGSYIGNGGTQTIQLGFTPQVIFVYSSITRFAMACRGQNNSLYRIVDGGFTVSNSAGYYYNGEGSTYIFLALT